jgi:hypothetical protein
VEAKDAVEAETVGFMVIGIVPILGRHKMSSRGAGRVMPMGIMDDTMDTRADRSNQTEAGQQRPEKRLDGMDTLNHGAAKLLPLDPDAKR